MPRLKNVPYETKNKARQALDGGRADQKNNRSVTPWTPTAQAVLVFYCVLGMLYVFLAEIGVIP